ncbi:MAG: ACP S-malonyltransferase [Victivallales bacterium]|nr:ACP S-malonyltransferase [Victivallales bacterium]
MARIGFIFAGQGAQYAGMGKGLAEKSPAARTIFAEADKLLGYSISQLCFEGTLEDLTPCAVCQPAIFTVSMAAHAAYLEQGGCTPSGCGGLSLGEFSAACAAGVFSFETALRLVALRGRLMDDCCQRHPGGMAAIIGGQPEDIQAVCAECGIDVANYNCPGQIVISGPHDALDRAVELLAPKCLRAVKLTVAGAYHSRLMNEAAERFGEALATTEINAPAVPFAQNVPGALVTSPENIRDNLRRQVASSVRWEDCARALMPLSDSFAEFGPGNVLSGFMKRIDRKFPAAPALSLD